MRCTSVLPQANPRSLVLSAHRGGIPAHRRGVLHRHWHFVPAVRAVPRDRLGGSGGAHGHLAGHPGGAGVPAGAHRGDRTARHLAGGTDRVVPRRRDRTDLQNLPAAKSKEKGLTMNLPQMPLLRAIQAYFCPRIPWGLSGSARRLFFLPSPFYALEKRTRIIGLLSGLRFGLRFGIGVTKQGNGRADSVIWNDRFGDMERPKRTAGVENLWKSVETSQHPGGFIPPGHPSVPVIPLFWCGFSPAEYAILETVSSGKGGKR